MENQDKLRPDGPGHEARMHTLHYFFVSFMIFFQSDLLEKSNGVFLCPPKSSGRVSTVYICYVEIYRVCNTTNAQCIAGEIFSG